jgi:hypothetical protein
VGVFEMFGDAFDERGRAGDGDGEDGVGEVVAVGDESGFGGWAAGAAAGAQLLLPGVAATDGVEVGVRGAGPVDAHGEGQVLVAGCVGQVIEGLEGLGAFASGAGGEHAGQGGAGGVRGGVAVVEGGAGAVGGQRAGQAEQQATHAAAGASVAASWRAVSMRVSKPSWRWPRCSASSHWAVAYPWPMRWRVPISRVRV